jgi:hypothetical protein
MYGRHSGFFITEPVTKYVLLISKELEKEVFFKQFTENYSGCKCIVIPPAEMLNQLDILKKGSVPIGVVLTASLEQTDPDILAALKNLKNSNIMVVSYQSGDFYRYLESVPRAHLSVLKAENEGSVRNHPGVV